MKLIRCTSLIAALFLNAASTLAFAQEPGPASRPVVQEAPDVNEPAPLERWQKMTPEERAKLKERFDELRKMSPEEREALRARARELETERERLEEKLGPDMRERLRHLPPEERDRILREHQMDERRRAGETVREGLDPERADWVERMMGHDHPRPSHDLRRELRGKLEDRMIERWHDGGSLDAKERERLMALSPKARVDELLRIHRDRIVKAVDVSGLPEGVKLEKWQKLLAEPKPERFLKQARKLGLDCLAPPPGDPGQPGAGRGPMPHEGKGNGRPPFSPAMHELGELLRPTFEDRMDAADKPEEERHVLIDGRVAKRLRERLADSTWLAELERLPLKGLGDGELIDKMRGFMRAQRGQRGPEEREPSRRGGPR